ncbi:MAG: bacteriocin-type signal sequence [Betaproteobacteria bacterium]|nr:bacteriocin-type signal sequence [Betaproteobacteria bacterium]
MKEMQDVKFHEEIQKMEYEPMDATEISLVRNSLILGVVLLVVLYFVSGWLFPGAHA